MVQCVYWQGDDLSSNILLPEIMAPSELPPTEGSEFWHILPCSASTARDMKRSWIILNKNSARAFQRAISQGFTPP